MAQSRKLEIESRIREAIVGLLPLVRLGSSDVELIAFEFDSGLVTLRLAGDCPDCDMSAMSLLRGIEAHLKQRVPEIRAVQAETTASA